ncbi:MAG TPA: AHH domain-containing protein [Spirochaetota bacterium]|nr:AHH domain-containing protein [Spirochaetota bacterium]HOS33287.1 AHH domain-containing protein [Spirochaetota bacterium]HOS55212.1 AHH domain-containing protein [Spirochaetota bacterium]HPK63052.1 AHH domain-containing protein [Spirochaetota bacterium]HQF78565.1 AHH domain-containing protein [Spirochaetota bacterium]
MLLKNSGDDVLRAGTKGTNQTHHFLTNKSSTFTKQFEGIVKKYGLDLDGAWNKGCNATSWKTS